MTVQDIKTLHEKLKELDKCIIRYFEKHIKENNYYTLDGWEFSETDDEFFIKYSYEMWDGTRTHNDEYVTFEELINDKY